MTGNLLIVSNRLPTRVEVRDNKLRFKPSIGGLATGLKALHNSGQSLWVGWPGISVEKIRGSRKEVEEELMSQNCHPVFLSQKDVQKYYHGFCNRTIWPLFHYFTQYAVYDDSLWRKYREVNEAFCSAITEVAEPGDTLWIHDYHLMLLPKLVRERLTDVTIGFFLHIPFPSFEIFRLLPWRRDLLEGVLGSDFVGFHTYDNVEHFLKSVHRFFGYEHTLGRVRMENRVMVADAFPMGIDCERFAGSTQNLEVQKEVKKIRKRTGNRKVVLSVDRLDYSKGIPQRLEAFDLFLRRNPKYKEKVTLILVAVPSRTRVEHYRLLKKQIDELVGRVNGNHGTVGWTPVWYLYRSLPFDRLVALYAVADVNLITPLRDGMNLMAKEYIATKRDNDGVLILSEMAGSAKELGEAIIVNPNSEEEIAVALKKALTMPRDEQVRRVKVMQERLQRYDVNRWATDFLDNLSRVKRIQREFTSKRTTQEVKQKLLTDYLKSNRRLILLDYDGTLVPFEEEPGKAVPDDDLLEMLEALACHPKNEVVIVSGRDRSALEGWLGHLDAGLVAEHGAWIRGKGEDWKAIEPLRRDWKKKIRSLMELYVDRTPGSLIEEKEFSIVWHYRKADPELGLVRGREMSDALLDLTSGLDLEVSEGNRVVEVKNAGINKGRAVSSLLSKEKSDFILAIGDDDTDEDVFDVLPETAYSIKVGFGASRAKFNMESTTSVRSLLRRLDDSDPQLDESAGKEGGQKLRRGSQNG